MEVGTHGTGNNFWMKKNVYIKFQIYDLDTQVIGAGIVLSKILANIYNHAKYKVSP